MSNRVRIAPSLLAAGFARLGEEVRAVTQAGADWLPLDITDGHSLPDISSGPGLVRALRRESAILSDVHPMTAPAEPRLAAFAEAGADVLVAGTAVFGAPDYAAAIAALRRGAA